MASRGGRCDCTDYSCNLLDSTFSWLMDPSLWFLTALVYGQLMVINVLGSVLFAHYCSVLQMEALIISDHSEIMIFLKNTIHVPFFRFE